MRGPAVGRELFQAESVTMSVMRRWWLVGLVVLTGLGCSRSADAPAPVPGNGEPGPSRVTVHVIRASGSHASTSPGEAGGGVSGWTLKTFGRAFPADEAGLDRLQAFLRTVADVGRRTSPPHVSERLVLIRADRDAPDAVITSLLERCARVGLYKITFAETRPGGK